MPAATRQPRNVSRNRLRADGSREFVEPSVLSELFDRAKEADEFEFISTLLRLRGMEDAGWDPLEESWTLINQILGQVNAPVDGLFKVRLLLFLYCHVTEMDDLYHITGNMLRVVIGRRYSTAPFAAGSDGFAQVASYPPTKIDRIRTWAEEAGLSSVAELLAQGLIRPVRNAFFHSDYVLYNGEFRIKRGEGVEVDGRLTHAVPFDWLIARMELSINTVLMLIDLVMTYVGSYNEPKVMPARFGADGGITDVQLLIREGYGVVGFRSPPQ